MGLRQVDPLSPILFLFVMNYFSFYFTHQENLIHTGIKINHNLQPINHLSFANDIMIFSRVNLDHIRSMKNIMSHFTKVFGQIFNPSKTELIFIPKTNHKFQKMITKCLHSP